ADQRDGVLGGAALHLALFARQYLAKLLLQVADAPADEPAVAFELRFTRTAQADAATLLTRQVRPHLLQAGQGVFELREFDLQARLGGLRACREGVEDELAAVEDLDGDGLLEVARLRGGEVVVED